MTAVGLLCAGSAQAASCEGILKFTTGDRLKVTELAGLDDAEVGTVNPNENYGILVRDFDKLARPERDGWTAMSLVVGFGIGAGEKAIAILVWTKQSAAHGDYGSKVEDGPKKPANAAVVEISEYRPQRCRSAISVDADGLVRRDGKLMGNLSEH